MNKKGNITDVIYIGIILFALAVMMFIGFYIYNNVADELLRNPTMNATNESREAINSIKTTTNSYDIIIFGFFMALVIGMIVTSWFIGGYPIFMVFYFIALIVMVLVSMILSNVWETISQASTFTILGVPVVNNFPITNWLVTYLPIVMAVTGFLGMIAMFIKYGMIQQGGGEY